MLCFAIEPRFELELEKVYARFFLPPTRASAQEHHSDRLSTRGRAKGYAGLPLASEGQEHAESCAIEIVGMEAIRRDWTDLAKGFQRQLLEFLFSRRPVPDFTAYIRKLLESLYAGRLDDQLVYQKALRKPVGAYTRSRPPHVQAAALLKHHQQRGVVRYVWTRNGPRPAGEGRFAPDYDHYVEKQLKPICSAFTGVLNTPVDDLFDTNEQPSLFFN